MRQYLNWEVDSTHSNAKWTRRWPGCRTSSFF